MNGNDSSYKGTGYHVDVFEEIIEPHKVITDINVDLLRMKPTRSQEIYKDDLLNLTLDHWDSYNYVILRSWDLVQTPGVTGTIVRFEQRYQGHQIKRSPDFTFTMQTRNHSQRLKSNMDRLREEMDATLVTNHLYDTRRYSGSTESGSIQLILAEQAQDRCGWLAIADQLFVPIVNRWQEQTHSQYANFTLEQALKNAMGIDSALEKQRYSLTN